MVLRQSGKHYLLGILCGIPLAYAVSRWVSNLIFAGFLDPYAVAASLLPSFRWGSWPASPPPAAPSPWIQIKYFAASNNQCQTL